METEVMTAYEDTSPRVVEAYFSVDDASEPYCMQSFVPSGVAGAGGAFGSASVLGWHFTVTRIGVALRKQLRWGVGGHSRVGSPLRFLRCNCGPEHPLAQWS